MICEICGNNYISNCIRCIIRVKTWGNEGAYNIVQMANSDKDYSTEELTEFADNYYIGKSLRKFVQVETLKTSMRILGYSGKFIGRFHGKEQTYKRIRQAQQSSARRWRIRKDRCELCDNVEELRNHHIVPLAWGGITSEDNCITLCKSCHERAHKQLSKELNRTRLLEYIKPFRQEIENLAMSSFNNISNTSKAKGDIINES